MDTAASVTQVQTLTVAQSARRYGMSMRTFRDRFMHRVPALIVSATGAQRVRRVYSVVALDEAMRGLMRPAA